MARRNTLFAVLAGVLLAAACSPGTAPTTSPDTTPAPPTTTTTTAAPATTATTTTTSPPIESVVAGGDLPAPILAVLGGLYSWLGDDRNPTPPAPAPLLETLADSGRPVPDSVVATGVVRRLANGDGVAVVHVGDDVIFMVEDAVPWRIAGAVLAGQEPWLGAGGRLLLVLGSDARVGQNQRRFRADSIHIVGVDPARSAGSILGFPRDSWVQGPSGGIKWTNLMAGRGPEVMLESAEELTSLDLDGYIVTGFKGFQGLIGDIGGLEIDLPKAIRSGIEGWANYPSGIQKLGPTALLRLARIRKTLQGGDFARSENQGLIMQAGMVMTQEMGVDELPDLLDLLLEHAWTDLSTEELLTFAATVYVLTPEDMVNMVAPGSVGNVGGQSVVFLADSAQDIYDDFADGVIDDAP